MNLHKEIEVPTLFDPASILSFKSKFEDALHEQGCKVIILIGNDKCFSKGLNLQYVSSNEIESFLSLCVSVFDLVKMSAKPVISKVKGQVIAGGFIWLGISDFVIAEKASTFCLPEASFDLFPSLVAASLVERVKPQDIKRMIFTTHAFDAESVFNMGLIDAVVDCELIDKTVNFYIDKFSRLSASVVSELKNFIERQYKFKEVLLSGASTLEASLKNLEIVENIKDRLAIMEMLNNESPA